MCSNATSTFFLLAFFMLHGSSINIHLLVFSWQISTDKPVNCCFAFHSLEFLKMMENVQ